MMTVSPLRAKGPSAVSAEGRTFRPNLGKIDKLFKLYQFLIRLVEAKLDGSFFRVRAERTTELELQYLRAMAELGPDPQRASDVAKVLGRTSEQLGPTRSRLIDKGLLYTPGYGLAAFTVPQFDRYMIRNHPLAVASRRRRKR